MVSLGTTCTQVLLFAPAVGSAGGGGGALQALYAAGSSDHTAWRWEEDGVVYIWLIRCNNG